MGKKIIARIRSNDNQNDSFIYIIADTETYQIEASNGDELPTLNVDNVEDLFRDVYTLWGQWNTFEWLAEYDETNNTITSTMGEAILRHDARGFHLVDKETEQFISLIDVGNKEEEVDWELIEQQAEEQGYILIR